MRYRHLAIVALCPLAACVVSPKRPAYQVPPPAYRSTGVILLRTEAAVAPTCRDSEALACAVGTVVIMPDPCAMTDDWFAGLLCHEMAHALKGWKHETE